MGTKSRDAARKARRPKTALSEWQKGKQRLEALESDVRHCESRAEAIRKRLEDGNRRGKKTTAVERKRLETELNRLVLERKRLGADRVRQGVEVLRYIHAYCRASPEEQEAQIRAHPDLTPPGEDLARQIFHREKLFSLHALLYLKGFVELLLKQAKRKKRRDWRAYVRRLLTQISVTASWIEQNVPDGKWHDVVLATKLSEPTPARKLDLRHVIGLYKRVLIELRLIPWRRHFKGAKVTRALAEYRATIGRTSLAQEDYPSGVTLIANRLTRQIPLLNCEVAEECVRQETGLYKLARTITANLCDTKESYVQKILTKHRRERVSPLPKGFLRYKEGPLRFSDDPVFLEATKLVHEILDAPQQTATYKLCPLPASDEFWSKLLRTL